MSDMPVATSPSNSAAFALCAVNCLPPFGSLRAIALSYTKRPGDETPRCNLWAPPESQADPRFQSPFLYTRITAKAMRLALIDQKGWTDEELPHVNTIGVILNRLGYKLRRVQKTNPLKLIPPTDASFDNVRAENQAADDSPDIVRISIDAKAKVDVGTSPETESAARPKRPAPWIMTPSPRRNWYRTGS